MSKEVGRSWRTHAKHELMNSLLGEEVGAVRGMGRKRGLTRHSWIDLTAGDAAQVDGCDWHKSCSPGILAHHARYASIPTSILLHEIQPATYDRLLQQLDHQLPQMGYRKTGYATWRLGDQACIVAINDSGANAQVGWIKSGDAVFVLNDPNAMTEWAMRDTFCREIKSQGVWAHRTLSTLGCNPAGLKRLNVEERILWYGSIQSQQMANPRHRDLLLAAIERDDAQWAYLISTATQWRSRTEAVVKTAFNKVGRTAAMAWAVRDRNEFAELKDLLFLTAKEREEGRDDVA